MQIIPADYTAFFHWFKNHTETYWNKDRNASPEENLCPEWIQGAKWIGMTDEEINQVQEKYNVVFTPEHRDFLRILHTIDRKKRVYEQFAEPKDAYVEQPFLYNWLKDEESIRLRLKFAYNTILDDVLRMGIWQTRSWGERPDTDLERTEIFTQAFEKAPKLIPLNDHRFLVADTSLNRRPVVSVWGADIVCYGLDLRKYLLHEFNEHLDIYHREYNEKNDSWEWVLNDEYKPTFMYEDRSGLRKVPFWGDFLM
jgi:hypothetical protein